jgi:His-Xaa-Ser system radical SAM maturase HxsC
LGGDVIPLRGKARTIELETPLPRSVWLITDGELALRNRAACLVEHDAPPAEGFQLYIGRSGTSRPHEGAAFLELPPPLDHLQPGDVVSISADGSHLRVLWRHDSQQNSILLTERCNNYCLMCSQPPKARDDSWLLDDAEELVRLLPRATREIAFTGGEPTIYGDALLHLLRLCRNLLPNTDVHVLSNGRAFAQPEYAQGWAEINNPNLMVGIPVYGAECSLHDYVVQAAGAFRETVRGILNLCELGQRVELRVVIHKQTAPDLVEIAQFIARNLPFVEQVALMGLEMIGFARANMEDVWIDPVDYRDELTDAVSVLQSAGIHTMVYNHQLCLVDRKVWPLTVRSISDWKNEYHEECTRCSVRERCGGFFFAAQYRMSDHIRAIEIPVARPRVQPSPLGFS